MLVDRRCVLLAEDDPEMRALIAAALRRDGYHVIELADGAQLHAAIVDLEQNRSASVPGVIVTDIRMPLRSGLDVIAGLRRADRKLPVVLITAFGDPGTHAEAAELGVLLFDKPFDIDDLRTVILNLLWPAPDRHES